VAITAIRLERVKGIEPSYAAWEAAVLPLNYTRVYAGDFTLVRDAASNGPISGPFRLSERPSAKNALGRRTAAFTEQTNQPPAIYVRQRDFNFRNSANI
jgi:hypothetical protein